MQNFSYIALSKGFNCKKKTTPHPEQIADMVWFFYYLIFVLAYCLILELAYCLMFVTVATLSK